MNTLIKLLLSSVVGTTLLYSVHMSMTEPVVQQSQDLSNIPEQERPFWQSAQKFVDAYAKRDAKAIGEQFTTEAEFYDEFGEVTVGRAAIVEMFQDVFNANPEAMVEEIQIERVKPITSNVALEEGIVTTTVFPGAPRTTSRYIALHVKGDDGVWRINTLKDYSREKGTAGEQLSQLSWMVGEWVSEDTSSMVHTNCRWSDDGNYLLRQFTVKMEGEQVMNGVQRVAWDPLRRQIRSWVFDSEGGFREGYWTQIGAQWMVTSNGVTASGETASGVAVYTILDSERIAWEYRNLIVGNELREDSEPVIMTRRPPGPETSN